MKDCPETIGLTWGRTLTPLTSECDTANNSAIDMVLFVENTLYIEYIQL